MLSRLRLLPLLVIVFLAPTHAANACSCGPVPTVLDSYDGSNVVVIARAVSVEKAGPEKTAPKGQMSNGENYVDGVKSTTMRVEQVFKGRLKVGDEMIFAQGGGADCIWTFNEEAIGKKYLFYLRRLKDSTVWIAGTCGRSHNVEYATDDLLYLENLKTLLGRTRISGTLEFLSDSDSSLADRKVRIVGTNKSYEIRTDKDGVYEIYDLPAGKYFIEPEIPAGWRVASFYLGYSASFVGNDREKSPNKIPIVLQPGKHAALDVHFEIDSAVRGTVSDTSGNPMNGVCLNLVPSDPEVKNGPYLADCSEGDGRFLIDVIPPGSYLLVVNKEGKISSSEPFPTFYYPNVFERERAAVITIAAGQHITDLDIHAPQMEPTVTVTGKFTYSDGKPVSDEFVEFKSITSSKTIDGEARTKTDDNGRFAIRILKGLRGPLYGAMFTYIGEFENCPKLDAAIRRTGIDAPELRTPSIAIEAEKDLFDVELKYPFPGCKKSKE